MAAAVEPQLPSDPHIPPPPPMSTSKQNRILIWRREVASALDDAASNASSHSSSSTVTNSTTATSASGSHQAGAGGAAALSPTLPNHADSPTSSFSSSSLPSSRPRALWKRLSRRLAIHHGPDSGAPVESPRTAMYRDIPPDPSLALEGLTVVDGGGADRPEVVDAPAPVQPTTAARNDAEEQHPLGAESSSDGGGRGLRERQERLQRAARLLEHGPKKDEMAPVVSVTVMN